MPAIRKYRSKRAEIYVGFWWHGPPHLYLIGWGNKEIQRREEFTRIKPV